MENELKNIEYEGVVENVETGTKGLYAFVLARKGDGSEFKSTFSCKPPVWNEPHVPNPGETVFVSDIFEKTDRQGKKGWCAGKARAKRLE